MSEIGPLVLAGEDLKAAQLVVSWSAVHQLSEPDDYVSVEEVLHALKVMRLADNIGLPGEPLYPTQHGLLLDDAEAVLLGHLQDGVAFMARDAITSGCPTEPPLTPTHATYYGAIVTAAGRVRGLLEAGVS